MTQAHELPESFAPTSEDALIPGTELTISGLLAELGTGRMIEDVLARHPSLTRPMVDRVLHFLSENPEFKKSWSRVANDYKKVWNACASDRRSAFRMVDESLDEAHMRKQAAPTSALLKRALALGPSDRVFEIGCGVARLGRELIEGIGHWVGVDVSENMLRISGERLAAFPGRFTLVASSGADLAGLASASLDKGYCHAVFIHMDKEDFYNYLLEVRRVLRPDGLFYFDVWNLCDELGWRRFEVERRMYASRLERPAHRNQFHSPDEVRCMLRHAGLEPLSFATNYHVQVVASHAGAGPADAAWRARMDAKYAGAFAHGRWTDEDVAGFRGAIDELGGSPATS